jgi:hypothetical protein
MSMETLEKRRAACSTSLMATKCEPLGNGRGEAVDVIAFGVDAELAEE